MNTKNKWLLQVLTLINNTHSLTCWLLSLITHYNAHVRWDLGRKHSLGMLPPNFLIMYNVHIVCVQNGVKVSSHARKHTMATNKQTSKQPTTTKQATSANMLRLVGDVWQPCLYLGETPVVLDYIAGTQQVVYNNQLIMTVSYYVRGKCREILRGVANITLLYRQWIAVNRT